jgi:hypothetical protein
MDADARATQPARARPGPQTTDRSGDKKDFLLFRTGGGARFQLGDARRVAGTAFLHAEQVPRSAGAEV